ncbi:hypothetical protein AB0I66_00545 [Streptomyces sp. NPDC050439]|uniref:SbtR family transcriptional regulator n=1 Tax=unclassified Streptomyces TaxID=2593676 RepID=UPI0034235E6B
MDSADDALSRWLGAFLDHARADHGMGSALMVNGPGAPHFDCHQLILNAATSLLTRAQRRGTARADVTAGDLVQLVTGIALSTVRDEDTDQANRLLALVLDAACASSQSPRSRRPTRTRRVPLGGVPRRLPAAPGVSGSMGRLADGADCR